MTARGDLFRKQRYEFFIRRPSFLFLYRCDVPVHPRMQSRIAGMRTPPPKKTINALARIGSTAVQACTTRACVERSFRKYQEKSPRRFRAGCFPLLHFLTYRYSSVLRVYWWSIIFRHLRPWLVLSLGSFFSEYTARCTHVRVSSGRVLELFGESTSALQN